MSSAINTSRKTRILLASFFLLIQTAGAAGADEPNQNAKPESQPVAASSEKKFIVTGLFGGFQALGGDTNLKKLQFTYGGRVGYAIDERYRLSAQVTASSGADNRGAEENSGFRFYEITLIPTAHFGGFYIGPQIGLGLRAGNDDTVNPNQSFTKSSFAFGADIGYEIEVSDQFSISHDVQFTQIGATTVPTNTDPTINGPTRTAPAEVILKFMLALNLKF